MKRTLLSVIESDYFMAAALALAVTFAFGLLLFSATPL